MTGLDTNILVRYLVEDDDAEFQSVLMLLNNDRENFYISDVVLLELEWVLRSRYQWPPESIVAGLEVLLGLDCFCFNDIAELRRAVAAMKRGADLTDELIAADYRRHRCRRVASFDKKFGRNHPKFVFRPQA